MDAFWLVLNGIQANLYLIGLYALVDYTLPIVGGPLLGALPIEAQNLAGYAWNGVTFITKQIMFHYFSASQIKQLLGY